VNKFVWLVRRELWEARSVWVAPAVLAAILVVGTLLGALLTGTISLDGLGPDQAAKVHQKLTPDHLDGIAALALGFIALLFLVLVMFTQFLYAVDALYGERRDRSILFWKSMPVSDTVTVLTKLAVALLVVPLLGFLLVTLIYPAIYGIAAIGVPAFAQASGGWNSLAWLRAEGSLLLALLVSALWYAPLAAWAMLFSVLSTRLPLVSALAPVLAAGICESVLFQTSHVWRFLRERITPFMDGVAGIQRLDLWLGLAAAAAMMFAVIRLRRYRDDT
jgi:ABC-2 type transport system permease protein